MSARLPIAPARPALGNSLLLLLILCACSDRAAHPAPVEEALSRSVGTERDHRAPEPSAGDERQAEETREGPPEARQALARLPALEISAELAVRSHSIPPGAPSVFLKAPEGLSAEAPLWTVIFLHGWSGCVRLLVDRGQTRCREGRSPVTGWGLGRTFAESEVRALFVVPQLAFMEQNGLPGRFGEDGFAREWLHAMQVGPLREVWGEGAPSIGPLTLVSHSAGYLTALELLRAAETDDSFEVRHVVLLDSLYDGAPAFLEWVRQDPQRRLVSLYTGRGTTYRHNAHLERIARDQLGDAEMSRDPEDVLARITDHRVVIAESPYPHGALPRRHLSEVLRTLAEL